LRVANGSPSEAVEAKLRLFGEPVTSRHMGNRKRTLHKLGYRTC
jgi:hypothetical protein